ncbi:MAG: leucine--tRNA ligase [Methanomicrobiales archaeon]|nr:leucine--tRNA ligase [Methanomicrobiales archaeon]
METSLDLAGLERRFSARWGKEFEADPAAKEKCYLNVAFPYPSGAMHVGHGRTYTVPDIIARFQRMQGRQVLFPMGFHVTGTPVIGISRRIAKKDAKAVWLYRDLYRVPPDVLETFTDPMVIVRYFAGEYEQIMRRLGLSIDWRRRFITVDPQYSRFIEWQYGHLSRKGYVVKGVHPVKYCPQCENPVGDHDLLEGDKSEIIRFVLVMFSYDGALIPTATLRPETIHGVTNLWVNPEVTYVRARVDGKEWIISREAAEKLRNQDHAVEETGQVKGSDLVGKTVSHPLCGQVPVLSASFVDPDMASGIVMSVPAHAPFDYIALRDLQEKGQAGGIIPVSLLAVEGYGAFPARDAVERAGIRDQTDPRLESVTQEVYSAEFARGRMHPQFGGKSVREARDQVTVEMQEKYGSVPMFDFDSRPVVCRCGGRVTVRILHDQWFLQYSNPGWKAEIHDQLGKMALVPPETRAEFTRTVDWLKDWACTRRVGLGTRLPWDREWIVEPLSDSTIYMAYYTIAHHMKTIPPEQLTPEVFDYLLLGQGNPTTVPRETLDRIRKEFLYWYPYDLRFSAKDLISNHLTFQLFHHRAIFPPEFQPKGMVIFGMGLLNGAKMSSSKGNVVLLSDAIDEFGADTVRMFLVGSAEPWQDFDWRNELVASTRRQIERFWNLVHEGSEAPAGKGNGIDAWLRSRLQGRIARATEALGNFQTRQALQEAWFGIEADLKWYRRRNPEGTLGGTAVRDLCSAWVRLLAPFIPYTCEDLWEALGGKGPVAFAPWPVPDGEQVDRRSELAEELLMRTVEDVESIRKLLPMSPKAVVLATAPGWKWEIFRTIAESAEKKDATRLVMQQESMRKRGKAAADAVKQITALIHKFPPELVRDLSSKAVDEQAVFAEALPFLEKEFGVPVRIVSADESTHAKAASALPFKPAIVLE